MDMQLFNHLTFTIEPTRPDCVLSRQQMDLVEEARKNLKEYPDSFIDWEEAREYLIIE